MFNTWRTTVEDIRKWNFNGDLSGVWHWFQDDLKKVVEEVLWTVRSQKHSVKTTLCDNMLTETKLIPANHTTDLWQVSYPYTNRMALGSMRPRLKHEKMLEVKNRKQEVKDWKPFRSAPRNDLIWIMIKNFIDWQEKVIFSNKSSGLFQEVPSFIKSLQSQRVSVSDVTHLSQ